MARDRQPRAGEGGGTWGDAAAFLPGCATAAAGEGTVLPGLFCPSAIIKEGYLHTRTAGGPALLPRFAFKKRYFWLSSEALTYSKSPEWQVGAACDPHPTPGARGGDVGAVSCGVSGSPGTLLHPRAADAGGGAG